MIQTHCIEVYPLSKNSFLHEFPSNTSNDEYLLLKHDGTSFSFLEFLSNSHGQVYPLGTIANYPRYAGVRVDWDKIHDLYGEGHYRISLIISDTEEIQSSTFHLKSDPICRDNFFTIQTINNGFYRNFLYNSDETISSKDRYDLERIDWFDSNTYEGRIRRLSPEGNSNNVKYGNFFNEVHQSEYEQLYQITVFQTTQELYKRLYLYGLRGDSIKITDYNEDNEFEFVDVDVFNAQESTYEKYVNNNLIYGVTITVKGKRKLGFRSC